MHGPLLGVLLCNAEPNVDKNGKKPPLASQPLHCDLSLPTIDFVKEVERTLPEPSAEEVILGKRNTFAEALSLVLDAYRKAFIIISAGPESVPVEVAFGSANLMLELAKAHIVGRERGIEPNIIDQCVTRDWPSQVKSVIIEIEPYSSIAISLLTVHRGYKGSRNEDNTVKPAVRYHR